MGTHSNYTHDNRVRVQSETDESLVSYDVDMRKFEMINIAYFYKVSSLHKPLTQRQLKGKYRRGMLKI